MTPPDERKRYDSVGLPVGCEIRIAGAPTGEVLIKGDIVMSGYHDNKKLTRRSIEDGWYHSGDVGYLDHDGQLVIVGRTKNIIKRRGVLIHPESIDNLLRQSELVVDSCTVGVPDSLAGERVVTACIPSRGSIADLRAYLASRLSPDTRPDEFITLRAIPRNGMGKALISEVRDLVSGTVAQRVVETLSLRKVRRAPSERLDEIRATIQGALLNGAPISFAGFWGVGPRASAAEPDRLAIARLSELRQAIDDAIGHSQTAISLLLTDVHGRCNRFPDEHIDRYFEEIAGLAAESGLETRRLSEFWRAAGLNDLDFETLTSDPELADAWQAFPLRDDFLKQAEKRCGCPIEAKTSAFRYYCICRTDRRVLSGALAGTIFFTYNAPKFRIVLPDLPTVYWHSTKPGTAMKPWFM